MLFRPFIALFTVLAFSFASAQDNALTTPQVEHTELKRLAGTWRYAKTADTSQPNKGDLGKGEVRGEMLGAFFVVLRWEGDVYGTPIKAVQSLGYDVAARRYTGSWIDNLMNFRWPLSGTVEADGTWVINSEGPGPGDTTTRVRERYKFQGTDTVIITGEMHHNGSWAPFMVTTLNRIKATE